MPESPSAQIPLPAIDIAPCLVPGTTGFLAPFEGPSEGLMTGENSASVREETRDEPRQSHFTIDVLPDDVLLEIFDSYREDEIHRSYLKCNWKWTTLAHVCRRWRGIILASPQHLRLRISCNPMTPVKASLDIWPPFPIVIICSMLHVVHYKLQRYEDGLEGNIIAALKYRDRISDIHIFYPERGHFEKLFPAMLEPFPALTSLYLSATPCTPPVLIPEAFLDGHAPHLRSFTVHDIAFPTLPKFVSRTTHIVTLRLLRMPSSEYISISPEVMATCLPALPDLETLSIGFDLRPSSLLQTTLPGLPTLTRAVFPSLKSFQFVGIREYLEDFIARIDTPLLDQLILSFSSDFIPDTPKLHQFVGRTQSLRPLDHAQVTFSKFMAAITLGSPARFVLEIYYDGPVPLTPFTVTQIPDQLLSSVTQICNDYSPYLTQVDHLDMEVDFDLELVEKNSDEPSQWLELLRPFSGVRSFYVSDKLQPLVTATLRELTGERTMEVLPALENIVLDELGPRSSAWGVMEPFIAARQLSDRPIVIQRQKRHPRPVTKFHC